MKMPRPRRGEPIPEDSKWQWNETVQQTTCSPVR